MSEGISSLSLTVAAKDTASPRDTTSPLVGEVSVRVGGVPMADRENGDVKLGGYYG